MKKMFWIGSLLALLCVSPAVHAATSESTSSWYVQLGLGLDVPLQNWSSVYGAAFGGKLGFGYQIDDQWAVQLDLDNFYFTGTGPVGDVELRVLPELKYSFFPDSALRPYLLAGTGLDLEFTDSPLGGGTVSNWDILGGVGVEWAFEKNMSLFAEGKWNFILANGSDNNVVTGQDIPVLVGVRAGL